MNRFTGTASKVGEGATLVSPALHELRHDTLQDQMYHLIRSSKANGGGPFQSAEGLSLGVDLTIRYALDPVKLVAVSKNLPAESRRERPRPDSPSSPVRANLVRPASN